MGLTASQDREGKAIQEPETLALETWAAVGSRERGRGQRDRRDPCPRSQIIPCPWNSGIWPGAGQEAEKWSHFEGFGFGKAPGVA